MRSIYLIAIALCGLAIGVFTYFYLYIANLPQQADSREIRISVQLPPNSHIYENLDFFKKQVEEKSNGSLKIKIFHSAELYNAQQVRPAVESGEIEMGAVLLTEYSKTIPATEFFALPFLFHTNKLAHIALLRKSPVRVPIDNAILEKTGARVLWWQATGAAIILSNGFAVKGPEVIADKLVRVYGDTQGEMVRLCGGTPYKTPGSQQYSVYKNKKAEIGMTAMPVLSSRKLWEVMDTVTVSRHILGQFVILINEKVWQSLTDEQRHFINGAVEEAEKDVVTRSEQHEQRTLDFAEQKGMNVAQISASEVAQWKQCSTPLLDSFLNRSGVLGQEVMKGYRKVLLESFQKKATSSAER